VYIYGDSTAKADDTNQQVGTNFYTIIEKKLIDSHIFCEMRVPGLRTNKFLDSQRPHKNPNNRNASEYINELLKNNKIIISEKNKTSINDYINVRKDKDGNIDKSEKDPITSGQKYGHLTDTLKYFICEYDFENYSNFISFTKKFISS